MNTATPTGGLPPKRLWVVLGRAHGGDADEAFEILTDRGHGVMYACLQIWHGRSIRVRSGTRSAIGQACRRFGAGPRANGPKTTTRFLTRSWRYATRGGIARADSRCGTSASRHAA